MALAAVAGRDTDGGRRSLGNLLLGRGDDLLGLGQLSSARGGAGVALDADAVGLLVLQQLVLVEADDHAGEVVGAETGEGVVDELFGGGDGFLDVADEVDGFLVGADVP